MPHASIAPSTTQPTTPSGRKRGCESKMTMKTVARIQYTGARIPARRRNLIGSEAFFLTINAEDEELMP
jgi:hypothetical protein